MNRVWVWWLGVVALFAATRTAFEYLDLNYVLTVMPYMAVSLGAPLMILVGTLRNRPPQRTGWLLLATGQFAYFVADALTVVDEWMGGFVEPTPADVIYFASYLMTATALLVFIRRRTPGWDAPSAVDALVVAIGASLLAWVFVLEPLATDSSLPLAAKLTQSAYPVLDLALVLLTARLVLGSSARSVVLYLVLGSLVLMLAADTLWLAVGVDDELPVPEILMDDLWIASLGMIAAAALHPGMRRFDERSPVAAPHATPARLVVLSVAVLIGPGLQYVQHLRGEDLSVPLASATCAAMFLLVLFRMAGLVAAQHRAAVTDGLTGLHTRRHFTDALAVECSRAARTGYGVGLLVIDVDHFKRVNDTYGHPAGDRVLQEVARRLATGSRAGTVVARYGGEEFVVLAPHTDAGELLALAERLRLLVAGLPVDAGENLLSVTVSIGAACASHPDPESLMRDADAALYSAKEAGRNRSVAAPVAAHR
ncbi:diguanylate cyclase [Actinoplanes sp. NPDC051861]|uniref:GGDEF domain-containing protein n=1 Tax=Actinoplanes sp. NPDC051861 TaxID=3155170 RepID=UPI00343A3C75